MGEDRLRAAVETWATFYGPVEDHGYTKVAVQYDHGQAEYEARVNVLAALAPRPEPLDVERWITTAQTRLRTITHHNADMPAAEAAQWAIGDLDAALLALAPSEPTDG